MCSPPVCVLCGESLVEILRMTLQELLAVHRLHLIRGTAERPSRHRAGPGSASHTGRRNGRFPSGTLVFSASIATSRYAPKQGVREAENGTTSAHPLSTAARATLPRWSPSHYRTARSPEGQPRIPGELPLPLSTRWIPPAEAFWRGRSHARCRKKKRRHPVDAAVR